MNIYVYIYNEYTCLSNINLNKTDIFILGDLNVDYQNKGSADFKKLSFFIKSNQLTQSITDTTRHTKLNSSTLDLAISNCRYIMRSGVLDNNLSDHLPIYLVKKKAKDNRSKETFIGRSYRHFNEGEFKNTLRAKNWEHIIDYTSAESAWDSILKEVKKELDFCCPIKKYTVRGTRPKWLTNTLIEQMKDRDYFYKKAKRSLNQDDWNIAKHLRNTTNFNIRQAKANYIIGELEASQDDPKRFWRTIKKVFSQKGQIKNTNIRLSDEIGKVIDPDLIPSYINNFFINIGRSISSNNPGNNSNDTELQTPRKLNSSDLSLSLPTELANNIYEVGEVNETEVFRELQNININKPSGMDEINARVLKVSLKEIVPELTKIFNLSIKSTTFPDKWKHATVIPIPKTGDVSKVENYRPISLLPLPGKLLEKLIHRQVESALEIDNHFTNLQHGFRKNRSTIHAILQLVNHINVKLDKGIPTVAVFIDFRKAFDCVCHSTLLRKMEQSNLGPKTMAWISSYLKDRKQLVLANGVKSDSLEVCQGVPQGSILGPLFYILYANDIPNHVKCKLALYADDTVLYTSSLDPAIIQSELQRDLDNLACWCNLNSLTINVKKTKIMTFGSKKSREKLGELNVSFNGTDLEHVGSFNYLGVKLDQVLQYDLHAKTLIQRVSDKVTYLRRIRRFINSTAALRIYKNMILPILEYGNILLISTKAINRKKLQTLQNKALKCALGLDPLTSTKDTHSMAKLDKLSLRRKHQILQLMFKQKSNPSLWKRKTKKKQGLATRSANKQLFIQYRPKSEKFKKSITVQAPTLWNSLPENIQNLENIALFKNSLRSVPADINTNQ